MGFDEALKQHNELKVQLMLYMNDAGKPNVSSICHPNHCALGKWLESIQTTSPLCNLTNKLIDTHRAFHLCAAEIVSLLQLGRKKEAKELVQTDGRLQTLSVEMSEAIMASRLKHVSVA